jgi:5'-nucleotidase
MHVDAACLGNHEFDKGPGVLGEFTKRATFPILAANLDLSAEPALRDSVKPSTVLTVGGEKIGIVGAVTPDVFNISNPGPTVKQKSLEASIQAQIDGFRAQKINKIILLSHIGYQEDKDLAPKLKGVDIIVGGHSHTLLCNHPIDPLGNGFGKYPTEAKDADGKTVLIVQAADWAKVLGRMKVTFDDNGDVKSYTDAAPILVDSSVPEDPVAKSIVDGFAVPVQAFRTTIVGEAKEPITRRNGSKPETALGNLIADSMLNGTKALKTQIAFMNQGGIREDIAAGKITYEMALQVQPFANTMFVLDLSGKEVLETLELSVGGKAGFLHVSHGFQFTFDSKKPEGSRITKASLNGKSIDPKETYRIVTNNFLAKGGDFHAVLGATKGYRFDTGLVDVDLLIEYLKGHLPTEVKLENRITKQ